MDRFGEKMVAFFALISHGLLNVMDSTQRIGFSISIHMLLNNPCLHHEHIVGFRSLIQVFEDLLRREQGFIFA